MAQSTKNSRDIKALPSSIYRALTDPALLVKWQVPGNMEAKVHSYDLRPGGGYEMSLFYPDNETEARGKTNGKEDKFKARFIELVPDEKIVEAIVFDSPDPDLSGEMILEISLQRLIIGTRVTFQFKNIPIGIDPWDNEAGTISSLQKLAKLVEH